MKKATLAAGILALGAFVLSVDPAAATPGDTPKIVAHVSALTTKNACTTWFSTNAPDCAGIDLTGASLYPSVYWIYVAVYTPNPVPLTTGTTGLQFGISYQGGITGGAADATAIDVYDWTLCATLEFQQPDPVWPASGGGNLITWASCQTATALSPAGYFYVGAYSADTFRLTPRPVDGDAKTATCSNAELITAAGDLGFVAIGGAQGCNPCLADCAPVPVEETTWGKVKSLYNR